MLRRNIPKQTLLATELRVAYTFPGLFGIVLTIPKDLMLFEEWPTKADQAIDTVLEMTRSRTSAAVSKMAQQLGRAPIAALYDWAKGNAQSRTGAEVEWNREARHAKTLLLQYPEFDDLSRSIEETSEEQTQTMDFGGTLVGADTKSRRFHFVTTDDVDIRGNSKMQLASPKRRNCPQSV